MPYYLFSFPALFLFTHRQERVGSCIVKVLYDEEMVIYLKISLSMSFFQIPPHTSDLVDPPTCPVDALPPAAPLQLQPVGVGAAGLHRRGVPRGHHGVLPPLLHVHPPLRAVGLLLRGVQAILLLAQPSLHPVAPREGTRRTAVFCKWGGDRFDSLAV